MHRAFQNATRFISVLNEPVLEFAPDSIERNNVEEALKLVESRVENIPIVIGGEHIKTSDVHYQVSVSTPHFISIFL